MQAIGLIGGIIGGIGQAMSLSYQAAIAKANQAQAKNNAYAANQAAQTDVEDIGNQGRGDLGTINANQGASGIALSSPSFAGGVKGFLDRVYGSASRRQSEGNQQTSAYNTEANIQGANAKSASSAIPFALVGGVFNGLSSMSGGSLFGNAKPTMSPDAIPMPTGGNTLGNTGAFTGLRPRLRPTPAWEVY